MERAVLRHLLLTGLWALMPPGPGRAFLFVSTPRTWPEARRYCREGRGGDLASVLGPADTRRLLELAGGPAPGRAWLGLHRDGGGWRWSSGEGGHGFPNWMAGEPNNLRGKEDCVEMSGGGTWNDAPCGQQKNFVCYQVTGGGGGALQYTLIRDQKNWTEARKHCRDRYTDLAVVRDPSDNAAVSEQAAGTSAWIGLSLEAWRWADGAGLAFRRWGGEQPLNEGGGENCGAMDLTTGTWADEDCGREYAFFCSQGKRVVMKVGLSLGKSLNPNDPEMTEHLLGQIRSELFRTVSMGNTSLRWREQSDGLVFHQEEDSRGGGGGGRGGG
ncbi:C-type mannose receptor 2-like isoform X2 [Lepisosteus oculatus]